MTFTIPLWLIWFQLGIWFVLLVMLFTLAGRIRILVRERADVLAELKNLTGTIRQKVPFDTEISNKSQL